MQVQVHHVHAEVAGPHLAHQRIHVGAVHVEQRALGVQNVGDLVNLVLEDAQRRGVGEHQRRGVFVHLPRESFEIDAAVGIRLEILDRVAAEGRRGRVGAVRRVGNQNLLARIALRLVPGAREQDSRELAVRARRRLQRDRVHAGDFEQASLQQVQNLENPLRERVGPVRMRLGQPLDARDKFVHARVVLHGARAQRIHAEIDRVVPSGEAREVADNLDLGELGQLRVVSCACAAPSSALGIRQQARRAAAVCKRACPATTSRRAAPRSASGCGRTLPNVCGPGFCVVLPCPTPPPLRRQHASPPRRSARASSLPSRTRACSSAARDTSGSTRCHRRSCCRAAAGSMPPALRRSARTNSWKRGAPAKRSFAPG